MHTPARLPFAVAAPDWKDLHPVLFPLLIVAGFCIVFPLIWCGVAWIISRFGWSRLARHYRIAKPPAGEAQPVMCGMVDLATCRGVLRFRPDTEGFFLWTSIFFRAGHPPLHLPWSNVTATSPLQADGPVTLTDPAAPAGAAFYRIRVSVP